MAAQPRPTGRPTNRQATRRQLDRLLRDPAGWPNESAPASVRGRVMASIAAEHQRAVLRETPGAGGLAPRGYVTMYSGKGGRRRRPVLYVRPQLAAAAALAVILSAVAQYAQQGPASAARTASQSAGTPAAGMLASRSPAGRDAAGGFDDLGRREAEALASDARRFGEHLSGRLPMPSDAPTHSPPLVPAPTQAPPAPGGGERMPPR